MASRFHVSVKTPEKPRESRSFKARLERELAKTQRLPEHPELQSTLDFCSQPKEASVKLTGVVQRGKVPSPKKTVTPSKSASVLKKRPVVTPTKTTTTRPASRQGKQLPPELRKLYEMMKGVSPIPCQQPKPLPKEVREMSASPISDMVTSSDIPETEEAECSRLEGSRALSEKRVRLRGDIDSIVKTVAVYTSKGLKMYELRKV